MDPVTCPMCQGAIPGNEIHSATTCPRCGADLSALIKRRLAAQRPAAAPPANDSSPFLAQAGLFSLLAPCFSIGINLFGHGAVSGNRMGMLVLGTVCSAFIIAGFILGVVALFGASEGKGKAMAGICINGLLIFFAITSLLMYQKIAARDKNTPARPPKGWSYISGK